ncbi:YdcF family protein [Methylobacterium sp. sgz302541]|uniref:YdcF family protein n=1 Tax=unclassified Methylobacterium TaxID=2615210 RepID=UPI003D332CE7
MSAATDNGRADAIGWAWSEPAAIGTPRRGRVSERKAPRGIGGFGKAVLGAACVGWLAFAGGFVTFVDGLERAERAPAGRTDGIVALTGGAQRIGDAIDLLAGGYGRRLLISGVNERTSREEIARLNPTQRHWIDCCVDLDYRARNTIGNAIETRRWMRLNRFDTVAVVTSNYHMPRTLIEIDHALKADDGFADDRVFAHPVVTEGLDAGRWWAHPPSARLLASEYVKFLAAWVRTRFEDDPERSRAAVLLGRRKPVKMVAEPLMRASAD